MDAALEASMEQVSRDECIAALGRLFYIAFEDTGGSEKAANFLLSWQDARGMAALISPISGDWTNTTVWMQ